MTENTDCFNRAKSYLEKVDQDLAKHIYELTRLSSSLEKMSAEIDSGYRGSVADAMHALLLCQRVYFSKMWARSSNNTPYENWPIGCRNWDQTKAASIAYWSICQESEIQRGIDIFRITARRACTLASFAAMGPGDVRRPVVQIDLRRSQLHNFPSMSACYAAVIFWMLHAGIISLRWIMRNPLSGEPGVIAKQFGKGKVIWKPGNPFRPTDHLPNVSRGHIVHLYNRHQWRGHWLVSRGDNGLAYGVNNNEEGGTKCPTYDLCNLDKQFLAFSIHAKTGEADPSLQATAEVINPLGIPDRC